MVCQHPVLTARKFIMYGIKLRLRCIKIIYGGLIVTVSASATKMEGARIG